MLRFPLVRCPTNTPHPTQRNLPSPPSSLFQPNKTSFSQALVLFALRHGRCGGIVGNNAWRWALILSAGKVAISPRRKSAGPEMYKMVALVLPHMLHSAPLAFFQRRQKKRVKKTTGMGWASGGTRRHTLECEMDSVAQSAFHKAFFPTAP